MVLLRELKFFDLIPALLYEGADFCRRINSGIVAMSEDAILGKLKAEVLGVHAFTQGFILGDPG